MELMTTSIWEPGFEKAGKVLVTITAATFRSNSLLGSIRIPIRDSMAAVD